MIGINERLRSKIPTIIEGETGVGKTELLRVFSLLINTMDLLPNIQQKMETIITKILEEKKSPLSAEWEAFKRKQGWLIVTLCL